MASSGGNQAEKDNAGNLSLAGDGFDTVIQAKAALDVVPQCRNKVYCADILALAARDVVNLVCFLNHFLLVISMFEFEMVVVR